MKTAIIKKKSGGVRTIYKPNFSEMARLRLQVIKLNDRVLNECDLDIVHGFVPNRSPVTNALCHIGYKYTLNMDIKDFFDSVSPIHIKDLSEEQLLICFPEGYAKQGLPTSPALSNLAMIDFDKEVKYWCNYNNIKYTRYADDMCFSGNELNILLLIRRQIEGYYLPKYRFNINPKKTRIQYAKYGRRNITGVMVDDYDIYISRRTKRILRSAKHKGNKKIVKGLEEWSKLNLPNKNPNKHKRNITKSEKTLIRHITRRFNNIPNVWST